MAKSEPSCAENPSEAEGEEDASPGHFAGCPCMEMVFLITGRVNRDVKDSDLPLVTDVSLSKGCLMQGRSINTV